MEIDQPLTYPRMPRINTQSRRKDDAYIRIENAIISNETRRRRKKPQEMNNRFTKTCALDPIRRSSEIKSMFEKVSQKTNPFLEALGVKVHEDLHVIRGRISTIDIGNNSRINVEDRETENLAFSMANQKFFCVNGVLDYWGLLITSSTMLSKVKNFVRAAEKLTCDLGIEVKELSLNSAIRHYR